MAIDARDEQSIKAAAGRANRLPVADHDFEARDSQVAFRKNLAPCLRLRSSCRASTQNDRDGGRLLSVELHVDAGAHDLAANAGCSGGDLEPGANRGSGAATLM
jgi:hypothetical protein